MALPRCYRADGAPAEEALEAHGALRVRERLERVGWDLPPPNGGNDRADREAETRLHRV